MYQLRLPFLVFLLFVHDQNPTRVYLYMYIFNCIARLNILLVGSLLEKRADLSNNSLQLYIPNLYCKQFSTQFLGAVQYKHWCTCIYSSLEDTMPLYRHYHAAALSAILKLFQFSNFPLENIALLGAACAIYLVHGILLLLYLQRENILVHFNKCIK